MSLLIMDPEQKQFFADNGYLLLKGFYDLEEMAEMRRRYHELVTEIETRPKNVKYSFMDPPADYAPDAFNPRNVIGIMDQTLAGDYWFDQFTEPRIVSAMVDLLGPNLDFHNGKVRNKPPGFFADQGWHQDWPYELHSEPDLAAAITYLDSTDFEQGATEVISGSHKAGFLPTEEGKSTLVQEDVNDSARVVLKAEAGDVAVIHVQVVHRAGHNYTARSRNAIINEYKTAETVDHWGNRCAFAGLPLARNRKLYLRDEMSSNGNNNKE